jgi:tRNA A37 threonylcarbamoyltransferase TsaD
MFILLLLYYRRLLKLLMDKNNQTGVFRPGRISSSKRVVRSADTLPVQKWKLIFPPVPLCTDNGVMAAW